MTVSHLIFIMSHNIKNNIIKRAYAGLIMIWVTGFMFVHDGIAVFFIYKIPAMTGII